MQLPSKFGKYELLERIATGGMAEVYLARTFGVAGFEKRLVIKRIRPELAGDPHHIQLFIHEARIGVQLAHENVVQVFDLGRVGRDWYIAMEHLHGRDLNRLVKALRAEGDKLPPAIAAHVVAEVCRGLAYAHALHDAEGRPLGLVHRDVSPHNVLLTFAGGVKLVDFGIARMVGAKAPVPAQGASGGRPGGGKYAYMSPEQARGEAVDHRTDVFSAGIVLWELLVGHRLYQHDDPAEKLRLVQQAVIPDPADEGIAVDPGLQAILRRALAPDPADRYPSAAWFEEDLRAWLYDQGAVDPRRELGDLLARAFPADAALRSHARGLRQMVADVARLGVADRTGGPTPANTPAETDAPDAPVPHREERKRIVSLVVEIDGLSDLARQLDPDDLIRARFRVLRALRAGVEPFDGVLQRVVDEQALVLFGVPRTRSDDLSRAVSCALELRRTAEGLRERGLPVRLAMGVHAGDALIAPSRRPLRYLARGDTVRLARQLATTADHGEILVSRRILEATQAAFRCRAGPDLAQRGGEPPIPSFLVEGRRHGLRVAGKGPWLRRGAEVELIRGALAELQEGRSSILALTGEIGAGKSRLAREVRDLAVRRGVAVYLGAARPWRDRPPLEILRDLVLDVLGVDSDAPPDRLADAAERLAQLGLSSAELRAIEALLRVGDARVSEEDALRAVERALESLTVDRPAILILEDLHHLTPREQAAIAALLGRLRPLPLLILLTHTGGLPGPLAGLGPAVSLDRFDAPQLERLLAALLEVDVLDPRIVDLVGRTCEGNPLYVEEMLKFLVQEGHIAVDGRSAALQGVPAADAIPDSIAGLIAARIDALEPAAKGALQLAATIGLSFSLRVLTTAMGLDDPTPVISELTSHGLIRRHDGDPADEWTLASELVREAAVRSILGVQRRTYHRLVAEAIEHLYADGLDAHLEALAAHCAAAGRAVDAARYLHRAGQLLEDALSLERARELYERGLRAIRAAPETPDTWDARTQGEAMLSLRSGATSRLLGDERRAERALRLSLDVSSDAGLSWIEVRAHLELGRLHLARGQIDQAEAHVEEARTLARIEGDAELRRETLETMANLAYERGDNDAATRWWSEALAQAGDDARAIARCQLGMASRCIRDGALDDAAALLRDALEHALRSGDRILIGRVRNNLGLLHYWSGDYDAALAELRRALEVREGIGYLAGVVINQHNIGDVHLTRGDLARAYVAFHRSRELAEQMGWRRGVVLNEVYLGFIQANRRSPDEGRARMAAAVEEARALGDFEIVTNGQVLLARAALALGELDDARARLRDARAEATAHGLRAVLGTLDELDREVARAPAAGPLSEP
jgi:class 3 adenylate cyclase/tetratricopeptide (TPR) repeat protein